MSVGEGDECVTSEEPSGGAGVGAEEELAAAGAGLEISVVKSSS